MSNVMIDIETLSTRKDAAVLSIGLAAFDDQRVIDTCGIAIDPKQVFGHIDVGTVKWWIEQAQQAQVYSFNGTTPQHAAWVQFVAFLGTHLTPDDGVWANSPTFDLVILESWRQGLVERGYQSQASRLPWSYRQERDYRTLRNEADRMGMDTAFFPGAGVAHNPVDDAANQARMVIAIRETLARDSRQTAAA